MLRYRLKIPIAAIYDKPEGGLVRVTLPAGAILIESEQSTTLPGMVGVSWEEQHYSVLLENLLKHAERVQNA